MNQLVNGQSLATFLDVDHCRSTEAKSARQVLLRDAVGKSFLPNDLPKSNVELIHSDS